MANNPEWRRRVGRAPMAGKRRHKFLCNIEFSDGPMETACWEWRGSKFKDGYSQFMGNSGHRMAYITYVGEIPRGLQLDHLCRSKGCVNPSHLEAVTGRENVLRGIGPSAINARKTECIHGHPLSGDNLVKWRLDRGHRVCRQCALAAQKRHDRKRRPPKGLSKEDEPWVNGSIL